MKNLFLVLIILYFVNDLQSQSNKLIYGELLGNGIFWGSINYDQRFKKENDGLGFRLGVSIVYPQGGEFTFPVMINYLIGKKKHQLELGGGIVYLTHLISFNSGDDLSGLAFTGSVNYRLNFDSGYVFRIGYTPIIDKTSYPVWLGLSFGRRF